MDLSNLGRSSNIKRALFELQLGEPIEKIMMIINNDKEKEEMRMENTIGKENYINNNFENQNKVSENMNFNRKKDN